MNLGNGAKSLYLEGRAILSRYPLAYRMMMAVVCAIRPEQGEVRITVQSDIVIDGFPRSANTFFVSHFELAQPRPVRIARHLHDAYQIVFAEKHGIPAVVLVREPLAAVSSAMLRNPEKRAGVLLRNYLRFYRPILENHNRAIIAPFEESTGDPNAIIRRVNAAYGTQFGVLDPKNGAAVLEEVAAKDVRAMGEASQDPTRIASPSAEKTAAKARVSDEITVENKELLAQCVAIFKKVMAIHPLQVAQYKCDGDQGQS